LGETTALVSILTEAAPLVLSVIILAGVICLMFYALIKGILPVLRQLTEMVGVQRETWKAILAEQTRINERLATEARADIARLEERVKELEALVKDKDRRIETLEAKAEEQGKRIAAQEVEITNLREENELKDKIILELQKQNAQLKERLKALEEKNGEKKDEPEKAPEKPTPDDK
jgi:chromosome segregation ATPase